MGITMRILEMAKMPLAPALFCAMLLGCSDPGNTTGMAEHMADEYYQAVKNKDFDKAAGMFLDSPGEPRAKWLEQLRDYNAKLGDLQDYKLIDKEVDTVYSGSRYIFRYVTTYSKSSATETLVLFDGVSNYGGANGNVMQIQGMVIKPKGS